MSFYLFSASLGTARLNAAQTAQPLFDAAEPVAIWLTVAIFAALIVAGIVIYFAKQEHFAPFVKYAFIAFAAYALLLGIFMVSAQLVKRTDPDYLEGKYLNADVVNYVLVPLLVALGTILLSGAATFILGMLKNEGAFRITKIIALALSLAAVVAASITILIYYGNHILDDGYFNGEHSAVNQIALWVCAGVLVAGEVAAALLLGAGDKQPFDSRCIALAGVCIALSFALSYVKLWDMPAGGSITLLSLLPVMLFSYIYGAKKGLLVGFAYGVMQAVQDPFIIHPAQFLLDYPIAFSAVAFAGAFASFKPLERLPQVKFIIGALIAGTLRYAAHVLSGVFAFEAYAADAGMNVWIHSTVYNSYVFIDAALVCAAGAVILSSRTFASQVRKLQNITD